MENNINLKINDQVIKDIVLESIKETEGVFGIYEKVNLKDFTKRIIGTSNNEALEVEIGGNDCVITIIISLCYGYNIQETVNKLSKKITDNIFEMTGYNVKEINVDVAKLTIDTNTKKEEKMDVSSNV